VPESHDRKPMIATLRITAEPNPTSGYHGRRRDAKSAPAFGKNGDPARSDKAC
jgi:hypothetical protein